VAQIVIAELEIGAVGTDFPRRTSWWARRIPGKGQNMEINEKHALFWNVYICKQILKIDKNHICLDETGCILNEKMMPDVTITVSELEIDKNTSDINISTKKLPDLAPTNPPIP
jgi:hypothetical protein